MRWFALVVLLPAWLAFAVAVHAQDSPGMLDDRPAPRAAIV